MSLLAGVVKDLAASVRVLASGAPKVSGTIYVAIRLELDGNASDGMRYCSTHSTWEASPHAFPEAAYDAAGDWIYQLAAAATTGLVSTTKPARIRWRMTDNVSTPASETASSGEFEDVIYSNGAAESSVDATKWLGTAIATPDTAGHPKVTIKSETGTGEINLSSGNLAGSVASVAGAVGSVTGAVGSVASGGIAAASFAAGAIDAAAIAANAIGASELAADAVTEIQSGLALAADLAVVAGYLDTEIAAIKANTDTLPASPATEGSAAAAASSAATAATQATNAASDALLARKLLKARMIVNTGASPWTANLVEEGTGTSGASYLDGTILKTWSLYDVVGTGISVATTPVGREV